MEKYSLKTYPEIRYLDKEKKTIADPVRIIVMIRWKGNQVAIYLNNKVKYEIWKNGDLPKDLKSEIEVTRANLEKAYRQLVAATDIGIYTGAINPDSVRKQYKLLTTGNKDTYFAAGPDNINTAVKDYLKESTARKNSKKAVDVVFQHLIKFDPRTRLSEIDTAWLNRYKQYLIKLGLQNNTIGHHFKSIKRLLNWAVSHGMQVQNQALTYKTGLKKPDELVITLTWDQLKKLYEFEPPAGRSSRGMAEGRDLFVFAAVAGGMRIGDLLSLTFENFQDNRLRYTQSKTGCDVLVPINKTMREILGRYEKTFSPLPRMENASLNRLIKRICGELKFNELIPVKKYVGSDVETKYLPLCDVITWHDSRRTFNTLALERGVLPHLVDSLMGHKPAGVKRSYVAISEPELQKAMSRMEL